MDPISCMATASASFSVLKKGFAIGRDIESMAGDLSRWMGALSDLDMLEKEAKNPPIFKKLFNGKSVEQEAIEAFAAKQKAQQQRYELQQWIGMTLGRSKWDELVKMEGQIRKKRQETLYLQRQRRRKFVEIVAWIVMAAIGIVLITGFVFLLKGHSAKASSIPEYVVCRLKGCDIIDDKRVCIYHGANNTVDSIWLDPIEFFPKEIQCKYDPNEKKPPTVRETLDAIRKSRK
ncbi:hypothetical protein OAE49_06285 [Gammaproteobacteria bacterium]|nr:hypothetical protein [Gammaproteobacteria bacterium]